MKISNEKRRAIKKIYDRVFSQIRQKNYYFKKPILKIITIDSSTHGSYCWSGFSYSKFEPVIKVNGLRNLLEIEATIKHEFAHMINHITYGYNDE